MGDTVKLDKSLLYLDEELPVLLDVSVSLLVLLPLLSFHRDVDVHPQLFVLVPDTPKNIDYIFRRKDP